MSVREIGKINAYLEQMHKTRKIIGEELATLTVLHNNLDSAEVRIGKGFADEEVNGINKALDDIIKQLKEAKIRKL